MGDTPSKILNDPQPQLAKCKNCQNDPHCFLVKKYQNRKKQENCPKCGHNTSCIVQTISDLPVYTKNKMTYHTKKEIGICNQTIETQHEVTAQPDIGSIVIEKRQIRFIKCSCTDPWHLCGQIIENAECNRCQCHKCIESMSKTMSQLLGNYSSD